MEKNTFRNIRLAGCLIALLMGVSCCQFFETTPFTLTTEAENSEEYSGWSRREYYTGIGLEEDAEEPAVGDYIYLQVNIPEAGRYYPWALAALTQYDTTARRRLRISATPVRANSQSRVDSMMLDLPPGRALSWHPGGEKNWLDIPEIGPYFIIVEAEGDKRLARVILDKVLLSNQAGFLPAGMVALRSDSTPVALPPAWAFGVLYGGFTDEHQTRERVDSLLAAGLPVDGYWIQTNYFFTQPKFPGQESLWKYLEGLRIKAGVSAADILAERAQAPFFARMEAGDFFTGPPYEDAGLAPGTRLGDVDFENEEAAALWMEWWKPVFDQGLDFLFLQHGTAMPFVSAAFRTTQKLGAETRGRGFVFSSLSGAWSPESRRYPARWTGEASVTWSQPDYPAQERQAMGGLREHVRMVADPLRSTYEIPFLVHAAGGYTVTGSRELSDTLYMRWIQFSMFNPITAVVSSPANPTANLPYRFSRQALENFRYYSRLKLELFPYIYTYAHLTRRDGRKMIQGDRRYPDQYLFGQEMLVAPVVARGALNRSVYLPAGEWIDFYDHRAYSGDTTIRCQSPIDRLPLFVRAGSILPRRPYARAVALGSNDTLLLDVFPGHSEQGSFTLIEDDGLSNGYLEEAVAQTRFEYRLRRGGLTLTLGATEGNFEGMSRSRVYRVGVLLDRPPQALSLNGEPLAAGSWSYDKTRRWLTLKLEQVGKEAVQELEIQ